MTIYRRHCTCVYYHDWHRTKRPKPAPKDALLPGVSRAVSYQPPSAEGTVASTFSSPRNTLISTSGVVVAVNEDLEEVAAVKPVANGNAPPPPASNTLPFDEEAKLVYGVVLSLRTMMKKLSKK